LKIIHEKKNERLKMALERTKNLDKIIHENYLRHEIFMQKTTKD